jgi:hypothetical protein
VKSYIEVNEGGAIGLTGGSGESIQRSYCKPLTLSMISFIFDVEVNTSVRLEKSCSNASTDSSVWTGNCQVHRSNVFEERNINARLYVAPIEVLPRFFLFLSHLAEDFPSDLR